MLQDMGHTGIVGRVCLETDREDIVAIVSGDVQMLGAGLVVLQVQRRQLELRDMLRPQQRKAVELLAGLWELGELGDSSSGGILDSIPQHTAGGRAKSLNLEMAKTLNTNSLASRGTLKETNGA